LRDRRISALPRGHRSSKVASARSGRAGLQLPQKRPGLQPRWTSPINLNRNDHADNWQTTQPETLLCQQAPPSRRKNKMQQHVAQCMRQASSTKSPHLRPTSRTAAALRLPNIYTSTSQPSGTIHHRARGNLELFARDDPRTRGAPSHNIFLNSPLRFLRFICYKQFTESK
jgi:hypothetical protein